MMIFIHSPASRLVALDLCFEAEADSLRQTLQIFVVVALHRLHFSVFSYHGFIIYLLQVHTSLTLQLEQLGGQGLTRSGAPPLEHHDGVADSTRFALLLRSHRCS